MHRTFYDSPNMMDGLNSPQRNVPVLGADIIAQTFAGTVVRVII